MTEGDWIIVTDGEHAGSRGRVILTSDGDHRLVAKLLRLQPGEVRIALDKWTGTMPEACLRPLETRWENDTELYVRINNASGHWGAFLGHASECRGEALDDCAAHLGLKRARVPL